MLDAGGLDAGTTFTPTRMYVLSPRGSIPFGLERAAKLTRQTPQMRTGAVQLFRGPVVQNKTKKLVSNKSQFDPVSNAIENVNKQSIVMRK